jgi:hypothetical protein
MANLKQLRTEMAAAREQLRAIRLGADALDGQFAALLALAVDEPAPAPSPAYIGGELGVGGKRVERDKDFTGGLPADRPWLDLAKFPDTDFHRCKLPRIRGNLKPGTRLLDCTMEGVTVPEDPAFGSHLIYVNGGVGTLPLGFVIQGLRMLRCQAGNGIEIKGSGVVIADCEQVACRNLTGTGPMSESVRLRNGGDHTVIRNKGFGLITARGWQKWIVDNPGARVQLWAGTTAARNTAPQAVMNRPACDLAYVEGVASVKVGQFYEGQTQHKATRCFIHPGQGSVEVTEHGAVERKSLRNMDELRALAA